MSEYNKFMEQHNMGFHKKEENLYLHRHIILNAAIRCHSNPIEQKIQRAIRLVRHDEHNETYNMKTREH